jgi:hypothetical protein
MTISADLARCYADTCRFANEYFVLHDAWSSCWQSGKDLVDLKSICGKRNRIYTNPFVAREIGFLQSVLLMIAPHFELWSKSI